MMGGFEMKRTNQILGTMLAFLLIAGMLLISTMTAFAAETKTYLALGDSISTGYGLDNPAAESFTGRLAKMLGDGYTYVNKANDGETIESLYKKLDDEDFKSAVRQADIITLTIGGNDLMNLLYKYLADSMGLSVEQVASALASGNMDMLNAAASVIVQGNFEVSLEDISKIKKFYDDSINRIRSLNPDAVLIVATQYNPYDELVEMIRLYTDGTEYEAAAYAIIKLHREMEVAIEYLNDIIRSGFNGLYEVADVYAAFAVISEPLCNAGLVFGNSISINLDIHPNAAGHDQIAKVFERKLPSSDDHIHCICGGNTDSGDHISHKNIKFTPWTSANSMPSNAGNYVLMNDVTISKSWKPVDGTVLCLNGYTLKYENDANSDCVIELNDRDKNKKFTLCDCQNTGVITGGTSAGIMNICTFYMYGGTVKGNSSSGVGGGIFNGYGIFKMYGGTIQSNQTDGDGGGIYNHYGECTIYNGVVKENSSKKSGGGVYNSLDSFIAVSGNVMITGNIGEGKTNNLYLEGDGSTYDATVTISELESDASIGVSVTESHSKVISKGGNNYVHNFFSDDSAYEIKVDGDNLKLVLVPTVQVGMVDLYSGEYTTNGISKTAGIPSGTGYAHFKDGVLTVNNFSYEGSGAAQNTVIYAENDLIIKLVGENTITNTAATVEGTALRGVWVKNGNLTLQGSSTADSLVVAAANQTSTSLSSAAIDVLNGNVLIQECTVSLQSGDAPGGNCYGLVSNTAAISNAVVTAKGGTSTYSSSGAVISGFLTITNSKVTAYGENGKNSAGIEVFGELSVNDSELTAAASNASEQNSFGIGIKGDNAKLCLNNGTILASCGTAAKDSDALYIKTNAVQMPTDYWWRTSDSSIYTKGGYSGDNEDGSYLEITTTKPYVANEWIEVPSIEGWEFGRAKEIPKAEAKFGSVIFKYYDAEKNELSGAPDNAGQYFIKGFVQETDNYGGLESDYAAFTIAARTLQKSDFAVNTESLVYTGNPIEPTVESKNNLINANDFDISYENNVNASTDTAKIIITGKGNAAGRVEITFNIPKAEPAISVKPTTSHIVVGSTLSQLHLTSGECKGVNGEIITGTYAWKDAAAVMDATGKTQATVVFTPDKSFTNYKSCEFDIEIEVVNCDTESGEHEYTKLGQDAKEHWYKCIGCGAEKPNSRVGHSGGKATCTEKAKCSICGKEYGSANGHGKTEIRNAKQATYTENGYTGDVYCKTCGKKLESGKLIQKQQAAAQTQKQYVAAQTTSAAPVAQPIKTILDNSPQTGDKSNLLLWITVLFISGMGTIGIIVYRKKKEQIS